jgi:hypothetical protein
MEAQMNVNYNRNQVRTAITCVLAFLFFVSPAFAQEWVKYRSQEWGFEMEIPPGPQVQVTDSTYQSWTGFTLPAKTFSVQRGAERYSVMVVDYRNIQQLGREKLKKCTPGLEICTGTPLSGEGYWKHDLRGAMLHAVSNLIKRDVKVVDLAWDQISRVSTTQVSMINNRDQSRNYALVTMNNRLMYIVEGIVPANSPSAVRFGGSFSLIARDGSSGGFAYPSLYSNEIYGVGDIPAPPPARGAEGGARPFRPDEFDNVPLP